MEIVKKPEESTSKKSKIGSFQYVNHDKKVNSKPAKETPMNIPIITTLSVIGLGLLTFIVSRIRKAAAHQPILIERRQIIYKHRP